MTLPPPEWSVGDRAVLARVLEETRARTDPPGPAAADYVQTLATAGVEWLAGQFKPLGTLFALPAGTLVFVAWGILLTVALLALAVLVHALARRRRSRAARPAAEGGSGSPVTERGEDPAQRLDGALAQGDPRAALEALWWWLAVRLAGPAAEPSWTTRELLAASSRHDLLPEGRTFDRLLYGAAPPGITDVRRLAGRLRQVLP